MSYIREMSSLTNKIYKSRRIFDLIRLPSANRLNLLRGIIGAQSKFVAFASASHFLIALELIAIQYFLSVYVALEALATLRILSFFSLLPLFIYLTLGRRTKIAYAKSELAGDSLDRAAGRAIFLIKGVLSLLILVSLIQSKDFIDYSPDIVQSLIVARVLSMPWDSLNGFLFLRNRKILHSDLLSSRVFSILVDLFAIWLLIFKMPIAYCIIHLGIRLLRAKMLIRRQLNLNILEFATLTLAAVKQLRTFFVYFFSQSGIPLFAAILSEYLFYRITGPVSLLGPLYAQLVFLIHIQYHMAIVIALRFLRSSFDFYSDFEKFLEIKSRIGQFKLWRFVCLIAVFISSVFAVIASMPFIADSALSAVGALEFPPSGFIVWPFLVGACHCFFVVLMAATIRMKAKCQLPGLFLIAISIFCASLYNKYFNSIIFSQQDIFTLALAIDSLLHIVSAMITAYFLFKATSNVPKALLDEIIEKGVNLDIIIIYWKKGVCGKHQIITRSIRNKTYQYIKLSQEKFGIIFPMGQLPQREEILPSFAPFIKKIEFNVNASSASLRDILNLPVAPLKNTHLASSKGKFDISGIFDPEIYRILMTYFSWIKKQGLYNPHLSKYLKSKIVVCFKGFDAHLNFRSNRDEA